MKRPTAPLPFTFTSNLATLTDQHLDVLAHQAADGIHIRLDGCCNCIDVPGLREVVSAEVYVLLRTVIAHQRSQAEHGYQ